MIFTYKNNLNAIITGASRGIGKAIAIKLASIGIHVICISKSIECKQTSLEINQNGHKSSYYQLDISNYNEVNELSKKILIKYKNIDILINNAGITKDNLLLRMTDNDWTNVINTNLSSIFYLTKFFIKNMIHQKSGRIINISSIIGSMGNAGQSNYAASKAGINGFTKSIAKEVGSRGITVNAIAPGFISTDMTSKLNLNIKEKIIKNLCIKRLGTVEDVSSLVLFLISEEASYITGQIIAIDGGLNI